MVANEDLGKLSVPQALVSFPPHRLDQIADCCCCYHRKGCCCCCCMFDCCYMADDCFQRWRVGNGNGGGGLWKPTVDCGDLPRTGAGSRNESRIHHCCCLLFLLLLLYEQAAACCGDQPPDALIHLPH